MKHHPYQRYKRQNLPEVSISETDGIRALHLATETIQSAMDLYQPERLVLSYSQVMMAWLLFCDDAHHITHIGLGGGSMVRWLDHFFPDMKQIAIDINPQVVAIAQTMFELPPESEQFQIVIADGAEFIQVFRQSTDIILSDAFDGEQIIDDLVEEDFFVSCRQALSPRGIFVINLWSGDVRYRRFVERIENAFDGQVIEIPATTHGNVAVMALNRQPENLLEKTLKQRAKHLTTQTQTDFMSIFHQARPDMIKRRYL